MSIGDSLERVTAEERERLITVTRLGSVGTMLKLCCVQPGLVIQVRIAASEAQQLALLGNASALADELLPRAASKLVPGGMQSSMSRDDLRSTSRRGNQGIETFVVHK